MKSRLFAWIVCLAVGGCATTKVFNVESRPSIATLHIDGAEMGKTPKAQEIVFGSAEETHVITASRLGYSDASITVTRDSDTDVLLNLKAQTRQVHIIVEPVPGYVSLDGQRVAAQPLRSWSRELEFVPDDSNAWTKYKIGVERTGWKTYSSTVTGSDANLSINVVLEPVRKDLKITSAPPGAHVYLDEKEIGITPISQKDVVFGADPITDQWLVAKLKIVKTGYEPAEAKLSWDNGKTDYPFDLKPLTKTIRIIPTPADVAIVLDGKPIIGDKDGVVSLALPFNPDAQDNPRIYKVDVSKTAADSQWVPQTFSIGWEDGKTDYPITLKEIRTTTIELLTAQPEKSPEGWNIIPKTIQTLASKDINEVASKSQPVKIAGVPKGSMIDSLAVSDDGKIVFSVLMSDDKTDLRSVLKEVSADGAGGIKDLSDGKSLDLHPTFTADGKQIVYSSNRGGKKQNIWQFAADGEGGFRQLTADQTTDLWPVLDPTGKLYYQALVDNRTDSRIYMVEVEKIGRTDLLNAGGSQPRISPAKLDNLLVGRTNDRTGKRNFDLYQLRDHQPPQSMTNWPQSDAFDAVWSPDGHRIAFVSDRGMDEDKHNNYDIWVMDISKPDSAIQVTTNVSWDDKPCWSGRGDAIYFRSNRGGEWGIWKITLP